MSMVNIFLDNGAKLRKNEMESPLIEMESHLTQPTYGLGTGLAHQGRIGIIFNDGGQTGAITAEEEPINYNYIRLYETFYFKISKKWYVGIGYLL
jgi:hypothetical protein